VHGIVGMVTRQPRELAEPRLLQMVEALRHESFYTTGTWIDETLGVYVGWVAAKGSFADGMPLRNGRGDVLVFSGEEFSGTSDGGRGREGHAPEYLLARYEEDPGFLAGLNGRFHGVLMDRSRGTATLFNDRFGMHRLYYHEARDAFYFAAEAKALLLVRPELRRLDPRGLGELIACGCVMEDRTLFDRVRVLPGAAAWVFRRGSLEAKGRYFDRDEWEQGGRVDPNTFYDELREVFVRRLPRYFEGPERIGMSLTGGLDTRMIMAWQRQVPGSLPCYTFGGMLRECHDVRVARDVAQSSGQPYEVVPLGREFLDEFPRHAERTVYLTDGCVEVRHAPDLYLNERARDIAPIRMTGNYGGEVLRGVVAFKPQPPVSGLWAPEVYRATHQAAATFDKLRQGHPLSFAVFRQAPWHHYGLLTLEQTQVSVRSPYLDNDILRVAFRAPDSPPRNGDDLCLRLIADGNPALLRIPTDRGIGGGRRGFRGALACGLSEWSRKAEYAYDYGMPQRLARIDHALARLRLERLFLGRHKFCHFRVWYRDVLAGYVQNVLLDPLTLARPYLERRGVEAMVRGHLKGDRNYTTAIHKLLTLELLHRRLIDS
jgi:asparagine synthase (glutamine-hydrolysing)